MVLRICALLLLLSLVIGSVLVPLPRFAGVDIGLQTASAISYGCGTYPGDYLGDPIGGGLGYSTLYTEDDAKLNGVHDHANIVHTAAELKTQLALCVSGDIVYVADGTTITLSADADWYGAIPVAFFRDYGGFYVKPGVTLAGGRGGVAITAGIIQLDAAFRNAEANDFIALGIGATLVGLEIDGPQELTTGYHVWTGIEGGTNAEVANCEIHGFGYVGVAIYQTTGLWVHHCYIHNCQQTGYGYGVGVNADDIYHTASATIEGNVFNYGRHFMTAAQGRSSYIFRYNYLGSSCTNTQIDVHGNNDGGADDLDMDGAEYIYCAGEDIEIYNNTSICTAQPLVGIRGTPYSTGLVSVYYNWAYLLATYSYHAHAGDGSVHYGGPVSQKMYNIPSYNRIADKEGSYVRMTEYDNWWGIVDPPTTPPAVPILIHNVTELQDMHDNLTGYYQLANDIDASATTGWNAGAGFEPIGSSVTPFTGSLNGDGFTISDLFINRPTTFEQALFGGTENCTIYDVDFSSCSITGRAFVGTVVGYDMAGSAFQGCILTNCNVTTKDTSGEAGGFIGWTSSIDKSNWANPTMAQDITIAGGFITDTHVHGSEDIGGLAGWWGIGSITNCHSSATIVSAYKSAMVGGLVGWLGDADLPAGTTPAEISNCSFTGEIQAPKGEEVGGLIGWAWNAYIHDCYSTGDIYAGTDAGGFIGYTSDWWVDWDPTRPHTPCLIQNCYATGDIYVNGIVASGYVGGFVGYNDLGTIEECFATGDILIDPPGAISVFGGFAGLNNDWDGVDEFSIVDTSTIRNCFSRGNVTAGVVSGCYELAGFSGENWGDIDNCYSTAVITNDNPAPAWPDGCFNGYDGTDAFVSGITDSYYDNTTCIGISAGGTGIITTEMKTAATFTGVGWDFTSIWCTPDAIDNDGYPILQNTLLPGWSCYTAGSVDALFETWKQVSTSSRPLWYQALPSFLKLAYIGFILATAMVALRSKPKPEVPEFPEVRM